MTIAKGPKLENMDRIAVTWSGGIDSTSLIAEMLKRGYHVKAITLDIYRDRFPEMSHREFCARKALRPYLNQLAKKNNGSFDAITHPCEWIWSLSTPGELEIPHRNKRIMDWMLVRILKPSGVFNLGMGEYVGADTWLVKDHVAGLDADTRYLSSYLLHEYGIDYRLITLADCGESRYKWQRLLIGYAAFGGGKHGIEAMALTTNCLSNSKQHCGRCYKCVERHAAFIHWTDDDPTRYEQQPSWDQVELYKGQMMGDNMTASRHQFQE